MYLPLDGRSALTRFMEVDTNQHINFLFYNEKYNCQENWNSKLLVLCLSEGKLYMKQYGDRLVACKYFSVTEIQDGPMH